MWKVLSGIIAIKFYDHMNQFIWVVQKDVGNNTKAPNINCLFYLDNAIILKTQNSGRLICTAWIDYRKANDSMPHTWICECLALYKVTKDVHWEFNGILENDTWNRLKPAYTSSWLSIAVYIKVTPCLPYCISVVLHKCKSPQSQEVDMDTSSRMELPLAFFFLLG